MYQIEVLLMELLVMTIDESVFFFFLQIVFDMHKIEAIKPSLSITITKKEERGERLKKSGAFFKTIIE